ncbi:MAG TPA: thioredoxin domain-containing protein, partial [Burkholderiales bacterium]
MPNRLARETSPYLLQHADNPVDWHAWGPEALERARREQKPILLSIGYSACHWCHVMARESFEDAAVAAVMNRLFVNVKVDREERPDLDQIYQTAHQMLAQRPGGWPLTMFLSPEGTPFFGGTYFPKEPRYGLPGFAQLCERIAAVWAEKRNEIEAQNAEVLGAFGGLLPTVAAPAADFSADVVRDMLDNLRANFDAMHGGFGGAPKFPHPSDLELCLRAGAADMALLTLERMCQGGIYDQLGGGFSRYSVDAHWTIPHFEKMLYDNGPLLGLLADAWLLSRKPVFARCAEETAGWLMREMQSPEGGYYSSLDADSEHVEGKFYVWDRDEVQAALSPEEYAAFAPAFGLDGAPNFEGKHWHLRLAAPVAAQQASLVEGARHKLFAARERRVHPGRDDKILVSWNALAIRGMAHAGRVFDRPAWVASARRALGFIRSHMWEEGRLLATYKDGRAHLNAYLDDYAFLLAALLELLEAEFSLDELRFASQLADVLVEEFEDASLGGFFFTGKSHERLFHRPKPGHDNATPSGNGVAAWALNRLAMMTGEARYGTTAQRTLSLFYPVMRERPGGFAALGIALREQLRPANTVILRGRPPGLRDWAKALGGEYLPDTMVFAIPDACEGLPA